MPSVTALRVEKVSATKFRQRLKDYEAAGVTYVILDLGRYADADQFIREAEKFITQVV